MGKRSGVWLLVAAMIGLPARTAMAANEVQDVTGHWAGYFSSVDNRGLRGVLSIDVSSQDGRRFAGEVCVPPGPCTPVGGTVSVSGEITMTGRSSQVRNIHLHASPFGTRAGFNTPIVGGYGITRADGMTDRGDVVAVRQAANPGPDAGLAGTWSGQARRLGSGAADILVVTLGMERSGSITGSLSWDALDRPSGLVGQTFAGSDASDGVALIGLLDDAMVAADLRLSRSIRGLTLKGEYWLIAGKSLQGSIALLLDHGLAATRQNEAKANLKYLYTVETAYFQEKDHYSTKVEVVGFEPERHNRYRYVLTANPVSLEDRNHDAFPFIIQSPADEGISEDKFYFPPIGTTITQGSCAGTIAWGITGNGPFTFTGAAYGDVDGDNTLDVWTVSSVPRWLSGSECDAVGYVAPGEPANEQSDVFK